MKSSSISSFSWASDYIIKTLLPKTSPPSLEDLTALSQSHGGEEQKGERGERKEAGGERKGGVERGRRGRRRRREKEEGREKGDMH